MKQHFEKNNNYEILTPTGWKDFEGIVFNEGAEKPSLILQFNNGSSITATEDHRFFVGGQEVKASELNVGDNIDAVTDHLKIISIEQTILKNTFDIFNADGHVIIANDVFSHQCDEMAFVRPTVAKEFWTSISPTLSTGGKAIITSTPSSDEDQFATIWKQANKCYDEYGNPTDIGINGFKAYEATWEQHPDRDQAWADVEKSRIGEERFRREHQCAFLIQEETLIDSVVLSNLQSKPPISKQGQVRWFSEPQKDHLYLVALDPSLGTGGDMSAIQVFESPSMQQVAEWQHNRTPIQKQIQVLKEICKKISETTDSTNIYYTVENNTLGEAALVAISEMGEENITGIFLTEPVKMGQTRRHRKGFSTTTKSKLAACAKLKSLIESQRIHIHSQNLISELKNFVSNGASFAAKLGETDDLVMATLLIVRMMQHLKQYHADLEQQITDREEFIEPMPFIAVIT